MSNTSCRARRSVLFDKLDTFDCPASAARRVEPVEFVVTCVSSRAVRQARHSQNACARHVEHVVATRDVTSQVEFGLKQVSKIVRFTYISPQATCICRLSNVVRQRQGQRQPRPQPKPAVTDFGLQPYVAILCR